MTNPKTKTKVVHSTSLPAFNIVSTTPGKKWKVATVPYVVVNDPMANVMSKNEAFAHAEFICFCFNNSDTILLTVDKTK